MRRHLTSVGAIGSGTAFPSLVASASPPFAVAMKGGQVAICSPPSQQLSCTPGRAASPRGLIASSIRLYNNSKHNNSANGGDGDDHDGPYQGGHTASDYVYEHTPSEYEQDVVASTITNYGQVGETTTDGNAAAAPEEGASASAASSGHKRSGGSSGGGRRYRKESPTDKPTNSNDNNSSSSSYRQKSKSTTALSVDADLATDDAAYHAAVVGILRDMVSEMPAGGLRLSEVRRRVKKILSTHNCKLAPERLSGNCTCLFDALELVSDRLMVHILPGASEGDPRDKQKSDRRNDFQDGGAIGEEEEAAADIEAAAALEAASSSSGGGGNLAKGNAGLDEYRVFVIPCDWSRVMHSVSRRLPVEGVLEPSLLRFIAGAGAPKFRNPAANLPHSCSYLVASEAYTSHQLSQLSTAVFMHWLRVNFSSQLNVVNVKGSSSDVDVDVGQLPSTAASSLPVPAAGSSSHDGSLTSPTPAAAVPSASYVILPVARHSAEVHALLDALRALGSSAPFSTPVTVNIQDIAAIVNQLPFHSNTGLPAATSPTATSSPTSEVPTANDGVTAASSSPSPSSEGVRNGGHNNESGSDSSPARRYLWHELLVHPEVQERFHVEIEMLVRRKSAAQQISKHRANSSTTAGFKKRDSAEGDAATTAANSGGGSTYVVFVDGTSVEPDVAEAAIYRWAAMKAREEGTKVDYVVNYIRRGTDRRFCSSSTSNSHDENGASQLPPGPAGGIPFPVYSREGKAVRNASANVRPAIPVLPSPEEMRGGKDVVIADDVLEPHHAIAARLSSIAIEEQLIVSMNKMAAQQGKASPLNKPSSATTSVDDGTAMEGAMRAAFPSTAASPASTTMTPSNTGGFLRSTLLSAPEQARYSALRQAALNKAGLSGKATVSGGHDVDGGDLGGADVTASPILGGEYANTIVVVCGNAKSRAAIEEGLSDVVSGHMLSAPTSSSYLRLETVLAEDEG